MPMTPLLKYFICITAGFCQPVRPSQSHQVLMSIQFPCDFAIPNFVEVKISDLVKSLSGSPLAMHRVKMPINRIAIFQVFVAEKIKLMAANFVGLTNNVLGLSRKPMTKQFQQRRDRGRRKEKLPRIDSC